MAFTVLRVSCGLRTEEQLIAWHPLDDLDPVWGVNLIKQPYLLAIAYEHLMRRARSSITAREMDVVTLDFRRP